MWRGYLLVIIIGNHMSKYRPPPPLICCTTKEHLTKDAGKLWSLLSFTGGLGLRVCCDRDVMNTCHRPATASCTSCLSKKKWGRTLSHSLSSSKMWSLFYQVNREIQSTKTVWVFSLRTLTLWKGLVLKNSVILKNSGIRLLCVLSPSSTWADHHSGSRLGLLHFTLSVRSTEGTCNKFPEKKFWIAAVSAQLRN